MIPKSKQKYKFQFKQNKDPVFAKQRPPPPLREKKMISSAHNFQSNLKHGLVRPQQTFPLQMISGAGKLVLLLNGLIYCFLHGTVLT